MSRVLDEERPDLVVFTGDVIGGHGARSSKAAWGMAAAPLIERGLPWCAVFGNHGDECGLSRRQLLAIQRKIPGCLTRSGPSRVSILGERSIVRPKTMGSTNGTVARARLSRVRVMAIPLTPVLSSIRDR